jgi:hypothetical protein
MVLLASASVADRPVLLAQVQVEQKKIVRIRTVSPPPAVQPAPRIRWEEKKGPKCLQVSSLAGAMVSSPDSIDLFVRGGQRLRAKLEKGCPSIEFYSGFYMRQTKDGRICQVRDRIHSRSGGECKIDKFRSLVPSR